MCVLFMVMVSWLALTVDALEVDVIGSSMKNLAGCDYKHRSAATV